MKKQEAHLDKKVWRMFEFIHGIFLGRIKALYLRYMIWLYLAKLGSWLEARIKEMYCVLHAVMMLAGQT